MGDRGHLHKHLLRYIIQKVAKYLLILPDPDRMKGIRCRLLLPVLVLRDDDLGWLRHGAVDVTEEARTSELGCDLSAPEDIVGAG